MKRMNTLHYQKAARARKDYADRHHPFLRSDMVVEMEEEQERREREDALPQAVDDFMEE